MQRSTRRSAARGPAATRPRRPTTSYISSSARGRGDRVQKPDSRGRGNRRGSGVKRGTEFLDHARDANVAASLPGLHTFKEALHRPDSISACSDASIEFIRLSSLDTDEDTNVITLNLMDYFLVSPENWLPELSYCKLHAACFLFASRLTGKTNTVEQIAEALSPDSSFVQLVGSPLADGEEAAAEIQYTISVAVSDVQDGYALLHERREWLSHLLGQYSIALDSLPVPEDYAVVDELVGDEDTMENFDVFESAD